MNLIQPEQKLCILIQKDEKLVEISCKISEVKEDRLYVDLPPYFMRYIKYLEVGKRLTVKVFTKDGTVDFNAVVITSPLEDEFSIELDENAQKLVPGSEYNAVKAIELLKIKYNNEDFTGNTFEISTDSLKFTCDKDFCIDEHFDCELVLPESYGIISFRATIIEVNTEYYNEYRISYSYMNEQDREKLLYYIYVYSRANEQGKNEENS